METKAIAETIYRFIKNDINEDAQFDEDFSETNSIGSMDYIMLIEFLERTFQIQIPDEDITFDHLKTVKAMANLVIRRRDTEGAALPLQ